ncbi:MAG: V-type ATP synthase subunit I [Clostridiales bacterium]|nr:V-type ATP synthase subunit I [Clostridiales bacterium]
MAISEMSLMTLVCLDGEKDALYDAFSKTGSVQIKKTEDYENVQRVEAGDVSPILEKIAGAEKAVEAILMAKERLPKCEIEPVKDGFSVTRTQFFNMKGRMDETEEILQKIQALCDKNLQLKAENAKLSAKARAYEPYACLSKPFSFYMDTRYTATLLGVLPFDKTSDCVKELSELQDVKTEMLGAAKGGNVFAAVLPKTEKQKAETLLSSYGFQRCPYSSNEVAKDVIAMLNQEEQENLKRQTEVDAELLSFADKTMLIKLYADYLSYQVEKAKAKGDGVGTKTTVVIEGYVPTEMTARVEKAVSETASAYFIEFTPVKREDFAPTLVKNGKAVENFEFVTNMYSVPAYGALDPNRMMSFFFSLFMGLIMGDAGYGLLMILGGFWFAGRQRKGSATYRMAKVFAYGGFFAILFGALFDSWFGFGLLREFLSDGYRDFYANNIDAINAKVSLAGISIPTMLLWCLGLGTVHIAFGQLMKAAQSFGRGKVVEGIFSGLAWAFALFALIFWVFSAVTKATYTAYAGYTTAGLFGLAILTSGITERGAGKVIKVFSSAYGLINYMSDILSYARLYGLMLSGAQIASIFTNTLAIGLLFPQGIVGIVFGVLIIVVGNLFNLAISLLGAYIHDSRLQYVEFFGKFYEGEGELFTPFGSTLAHGYFVPENN